MLPVASGCVSIKHPELERIDGSGGFHSVLSPDLTRLSLFYRYALAVKHAIALAVGAVALLLGPFVLGLI